MQVTCREVVVVYDVLCLILCVSYDEGERREEKEEEGTDTSILTSS